MRIITTGLLLLGMAGLAMADVFSEDQRELQGTFIIGDQKYDYKMDFSGKLTELKDFETGDVLQINDNDRAAIAAASNPAVAESNLKSWLVAGLGCLATLLAAFLKLRVFFPICGLLLASFVSSANAATVYHEGDFPQSMVVPDLTTTPAMTLPALLEFELTTNDVDTDIAYSFSFDDGTGVKDYEGIMSLISVSGHIAGIAPSIATWSDFTAGTGIDGGHVTLNLFTQDATPAYDPDLLFDGRDAALVTFGTAAGSDPQYATIAVPEPNPNVLGLMAILGICFAGHHHRREVRSSSIAA